MTNEDARKHHRYRQRAHEGDRDHVSQRRRGSRDRHLLPGTLVYASGSAPVPEPRRASPTARTAEGVYNDGLALKGANKWPDAETAFREATTLKPDFPEAWSELGHALRKRGRYDDSVSARRWSSGSSSWPNRRGG